jgi:hypothetical protein
MLSGSRILAGLGVAGLALWWAVRPGPTSDWVRVEAAASPRVGSPWQLRVTLGSWQEAGLAGVDLHWSTTRREPRGLLVSHPAFWVPASGAVYEPALVPGEAAELGYVRVIVYTGPTGRWADRVRAATTNPIPIRRAADGGGHDRWRELPAYDLEPDPSHPPQPLAPLGWLIGLVWLAAAVRTSAGLGNRSRNAGWRWRWLLLGCLLVAGWEGLGMEAWLGNAARSLAWEERLYHRRSPFQLALTVAALGALASLGVRIWQRPDPDGSRGLFLAQAAHWVLVAVGLVSLHRLDRWANASWLGIPVMQSLKLAVGVVALLAAPRLKPCQLPEQPESGAG